VQNFIEFIEFVFFLFSLFVRHSSGGSETQVSHFSSRNLSRDKWALVRVQKRRESNLWKLKLVFRTFFEHILCSQTLLNGPVKLPTNPLLECVKVVFANDGGG
jgi:hypothetical protein